MSYLTEVIWKSFSAFGGATASDTALSSLKSTFHGDFSSGRVSFDSKIRVVVRFASRDVVTLLLRAALVVLRGISTGISGFKAEPPVVGAEERIFGCGELVGVTSDEEANGSASPSRP